MIRTTALVALCASVFTGAASAQVILPPVQPRPPVPKIDGLPPELAQQLQRVLEQAALQQRRPAVGDGSLRWGGSRLTKADGNLQMLLGLEDKEGLLVTQVDPNSAADKAGLKANDVLVKINDKAVPNDAESFIKLVKDQKVDAAASLVVVRNGKEQTLKDAKMPLTVQATPLGGAGRPGLPGIGGLGGIGGIRINVNPAIKPLGQGKIDKLHLEMTVNGAKVVQKQDGDQFSAEYSKDELKVSVSGKIENGLRKVSEITVTQGKDSNKYASLKDVPAQHRLIVQQLLQAPTSNLMMFPTIPNLQNFPGLPVIPGIDD